MGKLKTTGKTYSVPAGIAAGLIMSIVVTGIMTMVLAVMIDRRIVCWDTIGYGIIIMIILASYIGSLIAFWKIRRQKLVVCIMTGCAYWGTMLVITALFFGGQYEAVGVTGLLVSAGSVCAALTGVGDRRGGNSGFRKMRYR